MKWLLYLALLMSANSYATDHQTTQDWLKTVAIAGRLTDFSGIFVYQYNHRVETYQIAHVVANDSVYEKITNLDGPKQEIIRHHGQTWCYRNHKMVQITTQQARTKFPSLLLEQLSELNDSYQAQDAGVTNVAGYATQAVIFKPKDSFRYTHKIWVNTDTGLLLKSAVLDEKQQILEQYVFTQLKIGSEVDKNLIAETKANSVNFSTVTKADGPIAITSGWSVDALPSGFKKSQEIKRPMSGKHAPVTQLVFSDGLSAISVFIEPSDQDEDDTEGLSSRGAVNLYQKVVNQHLFTVVGEVPAKSVIQVIDSIRYKGK